MKKQTTTQHKAMKEFGEYLIGKTIGEGTFGKVKSAIHKPTNQTVAIKILQKSKITEVADVQRVSREIHILKLIRHPSVVQLFEIIETPKQLFLVMQYVQKGELFQYIVQNKRINESEAVKLFQQLISGVEYIHKIGVVHRDLKPQNILLDYKKGIKIADFGLSNTYKKGELLKTPCGSPCYAAPEMIKGERYEGLRVDIWSCGVILFAMLCGYLPFEDPDTPSLYKKILSGQYALHKSVSQDARDLLSRILNPNQNQRYTIPQIRSHKWISKSKSPQLQHHQNNLEGIIIGYNKIPVQKQILSLLKKELNMDPEYCTRCLEANRHNNVTTSYYLRFKRFVFQGGVSACQLGGKAFDRSCIEPIGSNNGNGNKRRSNGTSYQNENCQSFQTRQILIDNFISKSSNTGNTSIQMKRKRSKSKDNKPSYEANKQNRCINNLPVYTSVNTQTKKIKNHNQSHQNNNNQNTSKSKVNESFNYGRGGNVSEHISKSQEKSSNTRTSHAQNRISRKYRQKFNQSLISRSKQKNSNRSRINSSVSNVVIKKQKQNHHHYQKQNNYNHNLDEMIPRSSKNVKKCINTSIKYQVSKNESSKMIKARRI